MNNSASTYNAGVTVFPLPAISLMIANDTTPNKIPSAIEYARGIITIVKKAGIASVISWNYYIDDAIITPTRISTGAVA